MYLKLSYHQIFIRDATFTVEIQRNFDHSIEEIYAVAQDISRVFLNLFNNAFEAMFAKKRQLEEKYQPLLIVQTKNLVDSIKIVIRDNGIGISKEVRNKLFVPFFTTKPPGEGIGLGLSISYDIVVSQHKGEIKVDSKEGEFAEFTVILPKRPQEDTGEG
jgi:signal transduction histidine kinase